MQQRHPSASEDATYWRHKQIQLAKQHLLSFAKMFVPPIIASLVGVVIFHPIDTMDKRRKISKHKIYTKGQTPKEAYTDFMKVVLKDSYDKKLFGRLTSLYAGVGLAGFHKILTQGFRFGSQKPMEKWITQHFAAEFNAVFGVKNSHIAIAFASVFQLAAFESIFHPIDTIKVMYQNGERQAVMRLIATQKLKLFDGVTWAMARNMVGSSLIFSVPEYVKTHFFKLQPSEKSSFSQTVVSNYAGCMVATIATNPIEVIKVRLQTNNMTKPATHATGLTTKARLSGWSMFKRIVTEEGIPALFRGTTMRFVTAAPRILLVKTLVDTIPHAPELWREAKQRLTNK